MPRSRFYLLGQVGQGQFGRVFCAIDRPTGNLVALKNLDCLRYPTKNFLREISHLVNLRHPNIVAFQGIEHHREGRYLVTDYCNGGTLREWMESGDGDRIRQSLRLILDVLDGLEHAHDRGIVHCDIKPENILLNVTATGWRAKISDFGISRPLAEAEIRRQSGGYTGSPAYMAPERFYGKYSPASDLYAVGILLYESIVGDRPFSGLPAELMTAHMSKSVKIPDTVPEPLRAIVEIALRKLPQRRYQSARQMRTELQEALQALPAASPKRIAAEDSTIIARKTPDILENDRWKKVREKISPNEFFILDRRYAVAVFVNEGKTRLSIVNRRGNLYSGITLPFSLQGLTGCGGDRYRLLGIEDFPDPRAVSIELKPLRVRRFSLDFRPDSIASVDRGFRFVKGEKSITLDTRSDYRIERSDF